MVHIEGTGPGQPRADANDPNPDCLTRRRASVLLGGERFGEHLGLPQACTECSGSSGSPKNQRHVWRGVFNITSRKNGETMWNPLQRWPSFVFRWCDIMGNPGVGYLMGHLHALLHSLDLVGRSVPMTTAKKRNTELATEDVKQLTLWKCPKKVVPGGTPIAGWQWKIGTSSCWVPLIRLWLKWMILGYPYFRKTLMWMFGWWQILQRGMIGQVIGIHWHPLESVG